MIFCCSLWIKSFIEKQPRVVFYILNEIPKSTEFNEILVLPFIQFWSCSCFVYCIHLRRQAFPAYCALKRGWSVKGVVQPLRFWKYRGCIEGEGEVAASPIIKSDSLYVHSMINNAVIPIRIALVFLHRYSANRNMLIVRAQHVRLSARVAVFIEFDTALSCSDTFINF